MRVFKRLFALLLALCLAMGCARRTDAFTKRSMFFFGAFDTMITIIGYTRDQATFDRVTAEARTRFETLHRLFDAYNAYPGLVNICALNQSAWKTPMRVDDELMELLLLARRWQPKLLNTVNIAMGGVTELWRQCRADAERDPASASLPDAYALRAAAKHADFASVQLDERANTVFFTDAALRLDVGAVAKGYATELVARMLEKSDMPSFLINAGGNVRAGAPPMDGRARWSVGIQDPKAAATDGGKSLEVLYLNGLSVVTSGDYQRYYTVDGTRYAHILSPDTLYPAVENRSVTVVAEDGALCDLLSTALFILPCAQGRALLADFPGIEAMWMTADGEIVMTDALREMSRSGGANGDAQPSDVR